MNLLTLTPAEFCAATDACAEGRKFAVEYKTMAEVWDACPRADWLLWITRKVDRVPDGRTLRLFSVWCARQTPLGDGRVTGDLITDPRLRAALDVAERFAHGKATDAELTAAATAAADAAYIVAACSALVSATAASASSHAAYYAAYYAADYAAYYAASAADASLAQADQFRRVVPNPFRAKEGQP